MKIDDRLLQYMKTKFVRDPAVDGHGDNCGSLVEKFCRNERIPFPNLDYLDYSEIFKKGNAGEVIYHGVEKSPHFRKLGEDEVPKKGDLVCMSRFANGDMDHIGVMVDGERFLHLEKKTGAIVTRLDHPFYRRFIVGLYRYEENE